jgi:hypothetical protein
MFQYASSFITMQGLILLTLSRISFGTGDGRYWNITMLMVYNAFHKSGRWWYTWREIILKECVFTSGNKVISEL